MQGEARWPLWGGEPPTTIHKRSLHYRYHVRGVSLVLPDTLCNTLCKYTITLLK